jgi:hypothetical protein
MRDAIVNDEPVTTSPDAPTIATRPECGATVHLRKRQFQRNCVQPPVALRLGFAQSHANIQATHSISDIPTQNPSPTASPTLPTKSITGNASPSSSHLLLNPSDLSTNAWLVLCDLSQPGGIPPSPTPSANAAISVAIALLGECATDAGGLIVLDRAGRIDIAHAIVAADGQITTGTGRSRGTQSTPPLTG